MFKHKLPPEHIQALIKATANRDDREAALAAQFKLAKALRLPLREAILDGDNHSMVFSPTRVKPGQQPRMPLHLVNPGEEDEYVAFVKARESRVPEKRVEGDYVLVPTYKIFNAIDWDLDFARDEVYSVIQEALKVMRWGFTKKMNDDGWETIISGAVDRNILIHDADAAVGTLTRRLFHLGQVAFKRNGGGNASSLNKFRLTDFFCAEEGLQDIYNWNLNEIPDTIRADMYRVSGADQLDVMGIRVHGMLEFGQGQEYQNFFTGLGASLASTDVELAIGLDLSKDISFYQPMVEELSIFPDPGMHRRGLEGYYGWLETSFALLDNRVCMAFSY